MQASQKCNPFLFISSTFSVSLGFCIRFLSSDFGNHCNYRGNHICLVSYCHRNACSVLWVGVGTRLANRYLVMGDFTVGTIYLLGGHDSRHTPVGFHSALLRLPCVRSHCNYRGDCICLVNCYHRNVCSVLCFGVVITMVTISA
jgi:hypothetical protein